MSSWYIFSSLGFYPVNPAQGTYILGAPLFKKATLNLPGNKKFIVTAENLNSQNIYVKGIKLNGKKLKRCYIKHKEIVTGGELIFEMTDVPTDIKLSIPDPSKYY